MANSCTYPLKNLHDHFFLEIENGLWLLDTGAPITFGTTKALNICEEHFHFNNTYFSLTTESLSEFLGLPCNGLLGMDLLRVHDIILDFHRGEAIFSPEKLYVEGATIPLEDFMGIPILPVEILENPYRMFLDTGAQLSYFQEKNIASFRAAGGMEDFFPDIGKFTTRTHLVDVKIGGTSYCLRSGKLPEALGRTLRLANVNGIIGNQVFDYVTKVIFSPRSKLIQLIR